MTGIIVRAISSFYYVEVEGKVYECRARGIFKHRNIELVVGDKVELEITDEQNLKGVINNVFNRKTFLKRPPIANVTQAILVFSVKSPDPNFSLIDRFLVLARNELIDTIICFNKIDLESTELVDKMVATYQESGVYVFKISAKDGENLETLKRLLKNNVSVVAGPSGAGKSTLINKLVEGVELKTGDISHKIGRGKHTTRHTQLIEVNENAFIADTPGFSSIELTGISEEDLRDCFFEFQDYEEDCRFGRNCAHENEPDCEVKAAVKKNEIPIERYNSYIQLLNEIRDQNKRRNY